MEPARGSAEKASPSPCSSSTFFRRRLGTGSGFGAPFVAAAQLACVLAVLFCVTSVTSIRSRCHASEQSNRRQPRSKSNEQERRGAERAAPI